MCHLVHCAIISSHSKLRASPDAVEAEQSPHQDPRHYLTLHTAAPPPPPPIRGNDIGRGPVRNHDPLRRPTRNARRRLQRCRDLCGPTPPGTMHVDSRGRQEDFPRVRFLIWVINSDIVLTASLTAHSQVCTTSSSPRAHHLSGEFQLGPVRSQCMSISSYSKVSKA